MDAEKRTTPHVTDERGAAPYIAHSVAALRQWRRLGKGPAFIRAGRSIRYRIQDLDAWLDNHRVETRDSRRELVGR